MSVYKVEVRGSLVHDDGESFTGKLCQPHALSGPMVVLCLLHLITDGGNT